MPPSLVILNVAEKPSVARSLAEVFARTPGAVDRRAPPAPGAAQAFACHNVRFPSVLRQGGDGPPGPDVAHTMITTSVRGHLASQDFGPRYGWQQCPPVALFDAPIETTYREDMEPLRMMLKGRAQACGALILWLDCDREGEAIADEVRTVCLEGNRSLRANVFRAKFSTVMPQEINRALRTLGRVNEAWVQAVQARSEHDLRVGAAFTRFQTLRLQRKFEGFRDRGVVSYGPCQFPTLGFVVERWARIETFLPEDFWTIDMSIRVVPDDAGGGGIEGRDDDGAPRPPPPSQQRGSSRPIHFSWRRGRLYDRLATLVLYESCLDAREASVTALTGRPKNKWRPVPLATVELQKRASRYLRIGSEVVMSAAEELYNQGYISYPRTETERFRSEFEHTPLIQSLQAVGGEIGNYASKLLTDNHFQTPRAGQNDDNAHPPITPAKAVDPQTIQDPRQRGIYTLVVKHYLACCSRDAMGKETTLTVQMASEEFNARGLMIIERNWLEIYSPWERWSTGQGELPRLQIGSRITPSTLLMKEGRTQPPQPISEVELISLMDRNGIGTDATIAQHITTILEREYAEKDGSLRFHPTKLGIALVEGYNSMGYQLNKPDLRREMEAECNLVAAGRKTKGQIMGPILTKMRECFERANTEAHKLDAAMERNFSRVGASDDTARLLRRSFSLCGNCDGLMDLKQRAGGQQNRGNQNVRAPPKILYCNNCDTGGLEIPRGEPSPMTSPQARDQPFRCPICRYQVIRIGAGEGYTGNGYQVCPKCYTDSPAEFGGAATAGNFRCFNCTHPDCSLAGGTAGGDIEVYPCPFCQRAGTEGGKVSLRKNSRGYVLSCSNYSTIGQGTRCQYTVWLPKEAGNVSVEEGQSCRRCSNPNRDVKLLRFEWKPGSVPPHLDRHHVACVLCDQMLKQDMNLRLPQVNQVAIRNRTVNSRATGRTGRGGRGGGRGRGGRGGRGYTANQMAGNGVGGRRGNGNANWSGNANANANGNGNGNGNVCFRCNQPGHWASSCPNS